MEKYAIKTQELTKYFGNLVAVNKINLKIPYGTTYGLLGPNGAGKTTTIRLLNCIISKTSGNAQIGGYDIDTEKEKVKLICGFLPESPGLYSKLSAREFLQFMGDLYYIPRDIVNDRITELLQMFELDDRENELLEGFSRGMKQKVCLCAALIQDPQIIFLDEPTSNLDPAAARMVKDLISELAEKADKTIFICTHLLDTAEELCDRIGIIDNGILKTEGSPEEIIIKQNVDDLEEAYLKIIGASRLDDLLSWRENRTKTKSEI